MSSIVVAAQFTKLVGQPATGLTLAEIDMHLTRVHNTTGVDSVVWDGTQNPTVEIENCGMYARLYAADLDTYSYFAMAEYTGATDLDTDYVMGCVAHVEFPATSSAPLTGLTGQVWTVIRGDTLPRTFAAIAADPTITRVQLTVKNVPESEADTAAVLLVDSEDDLVYLNGAAPGVGYTATFSILGVLAVPAFTMAALPVGDYNYDVQIWQTAVVETIEEGKFVVTADSSRSITPA